MNEKMTMKECMEIEKEKNTHKTKKQLKNFCRKKLGYKTK